MPPEVLSRRALNRALLARQHLLARTRDSPLAVVEHLAGLQAQQARPPYIGLWSRVAGFEREQLLALIRDGEVVRATLMRCTLHLVSRRDYLAFRPVLQPALTGAMRSILRERVGTFPLDEVLAEARRLYADQPRTFTELRNALVGRFPTADERAMGYAVRTQLPLTIVPAEYEWGYRADPRFTLAEAASEPDPIPAQGPHALVRRYLAAFGPATAADVQAWSGLGGLAPLLADLRPELQLFRDERGRELFDLPAAPRPPEDTPAPAAFVADFDNLVLSHADRTRVIADEHRPVVITKNAQVLPTFLVDGFVAGTWKVARQRKAAVLALTPFATLPRPARATLEAEGERLVRFIDPEAVSHEIGFED